MVYLNKFMNLLNLKNWIRELCTFLQIQSHIAISYIHTFCRKLDVAELENAVLRDPTTHSNRKCKIKRSYTIGTSGHFIKQCSVAISLSSLIKILRN